MTQKPTTITATYRIVTPMFCSGADQASAELRVPSFKGALRFWWRSLMWKRVASHEELRKKEGALFGASDQKVGQSAVSLRIPREQCDLQPQVDAGEIFEGGRLLGIHYLGYGVMEAFDGKNTKAGRLTRPMRPGGQFTVSCRFSRLASQEQVEEVRRALVLLGTVGGLGSKSRKGFGSLTLVSLAVNGEGQEVPPSVADRLKQVLYELQEGLPDWTAWSRNSRVVSFSTGGTPLEMLDTVGRSLSAFRLWSGRETAHFAEDHDLMFDYLNSGTQPAHSPARIAFGLPHNYFFRSLSDPPRQFIKAEVTPEKKPDDKGYKRRGSPLFLHLHDDGQAQPVGVLAFLPAVFLPSPARITISDTSTDKSRSRQRHRPTTCGVPQVDLWKPIVDFLTAFQKGAETQEVSLV